MVFSSPVKSVRSIQPFDAAWKFHRGEATGADRPDFDDASWRDLDLPHDWSIEGPFAETNLTGGAGGFLPSGIGWYRKSFQLGARTTDQRVFVEFDGVMENSQVWINGHLLGQRPSGYVSFVYELTPYLKFGDAAENRLSVRTDTSGQPASRWYTGAGIYRHVRLLVTHAVHFETWSTFVSSPKISADSAVVRVQTSLVNQSPVAQAVAVRLILRDPAGEIVATVNTSPISIGAGQTQAFVQEILLSNPKRWDLGQPQLYRATVQARSDASALDEETVTFGIREAHFEAATGFWLNGRNLKLKGACIHHDGGAFGAAVPLGIWELRLNALKELGVNAIRTAHNPPAPEFLDLCDRLGLLVMDELFDVWTVAKNPHDYHLHFKEWSLRDVRDTVRRDRNHPSIILYSAGNEIHDTPQEKLSYEILSGLVKTFHDEDPTRPVTQALFRPNVSHDYDNGLADLLDVIGTNYRDLELLAAHQAKPTRKIVGTEQAHDRRVWLRARDHPHHSGQFLWCGIDYLGESRAWPNVAAASGLLDKTGAIKTMAYERAALWCERPVLHLVRRVGEWEFAPTDPGFTPLDRKQVLFADWSPADRSAHDEIVETYSNCDEVELVLNGVSLGTQVRTPDEAPRTWRIAYAPGVLKAIARQAGKIVASDELRTASAPTRIELTASRSQLSAANWDDVVAVTVTVVDANGVSVPDAAPEISFAVRGSGTIAAIDAADISGHEPFQAGRRHAYQGRCVAFVRAGKEAKAGAILLLQASAVGLAEAEIELRIAG